jgi:hypothetical protein
MTRSLSEAFGWLRRQALSYLFIVAVLIAGSWLMVQYRNARTEEQALIALRVDVHLLALQVQHLAGSLPALRGRMQQKLESLKSAHQTAAAAQREKERERARYAVEHRVKSLFPGTEAYLHLKRLDVELMGLRAVTANATNARVHAENVFRSAEAIKEYEREAAEKRARSRVLRVQWSQLQSQSGWRSRVVFSSSHKELNRLKLEIERIDGEVVIAENRIQALRSAAATDRDLSAWLKQLADVASARSAAEGKRAHLTDAEAAVSNNSYRKLERMFVGWLGNSRPILYAAAGILLLAIFGRIALKLFMYYVVAPLASGRSGVRLVPAAGGVARATAAAIGVDEGRISTVSIPIRLGPGQELLVLPEYLQSSSQRAVKRTQWLLNGSIPLSSFLSGMFMLTRVHSEEEDEVVVAATKDALSEVCLVDLPEGAAFVCQPRSLAGVVQGRNRPILITRHWRVGSLQAWLTFQLRFLVFHGPGQLIVKGCRGVRMERAGRGRLINQAATLGFDANLDYANTRCETFVSYWSGKDNLFNDIFTGADGSYVYEEMPDLRHKSAIRGRGLEGILDAGLKVFGV